MSHDTFCESTLQILRDLSSQLGVNYDSGEIKVVRDEREFFMFLYLPLAQYARVGTPSFFEIKTKIPFQHPSFNVRKSNSLDWVADHILSMKDLRVGDDDFDSKFYIKVSDLGWEWGGKFFSMDIIRRGISNLLLGGFDQIKSEDGYLKIIKYGDSCPEIEIINDAIESIHKIILNFPENYTPPRYYRLRGYNYWKPLVYVIVLLFGLGAFAYWYFWILILRPALTQ